jgi:SpoVK/Ycf46/Vps4 family AAA+-type ATPase
MVGRMARARRRRAHDEEQRRLEELRRNGGEELISPFAGLPFGGILEEMMRGMETRSYRIDPETGEWVDMTGEQPPEPAPESEPAEGEPRRRKRKSRTRPKSTSSMSPFGMLGGMGMPSDGSGEFEVEPPEDLSTFDDVGGMEKLKQEVRDTVGLMLEHPDDAERYGIDWNGILLHGPPGVGKTFFARAIAGEYDMSLMHVSTGDLVASLVGGSARNIEKAFETALQNLPCLLFFDEFDSVAQRRDNTPDQESRRTVNQLLTSLEAYRDERQLLVMAATNSIEHLDPAVIRPGRFVRHIRIDLPDAEARRAIFGAELDDRPAADSIDLDALVTRTEGMTPAAIAKIVDSAALEVYRGRALRRRRPPDGRALGLGLADPARGDQGPAAAAASRDRGSRVREALRRRPADRSPPRRPSGHRQDDRREGPGGTGAGVLLSHLRSRRDQQVGR